MQKTPRTRKLERKVADLEARLSGACIECDEWKRRKNGLEIALQAERDNGNSYAGTINDLRNKNKRAIRLLEAESEYRTLRGDLKAAARLDADICELNG